MSSRIGTVLRLRALQERQALGALGAAQREVVAAGERVADRQADYEQRPRASGVLSPQALRLLQLQGAGALERVAEATADREEAQAAAGRRREAWSEASVAHRSAERLAERQQLAAEAEARARAARELDELVVLRRGR